MIDSLLQSKISSTFLNLLQARIYEEIVQRKYGFKDWDSVLAAIGHGGLKEGQVVNQSGGRIWQGSQAGTDR